MSDRLSPKGYRIVSWSRGPLLRDGKHFMWQCERCGAAVADVDQHARWHQHVEGVLYGEEYPGRRPVSMLTEEADRD